MPERACEWMVGMLCVSRRKEEKKKRKVKKISPTGNWTRVTRVTGGYTDHYTIKDWYRRIHTHNKKYTTPPKTYIPTLHNSIQRHRHILSDIPTCTTSHHTQCSTACYFNEQEIPHKDFLTHLSDTSMRIGPKSWETYATLSQLILRIAQYQRSMCHIMIHVTPRSVYGVVD